MDSETRRAIQALCEKLGHEWEVWLTQDYKVARSRCKICDKIKYHDR